MMDDATLLARLDHLTVARRGDTLAPHKPLLFLVALGRLLAGQRELPFDEARDTVGALLDVHAPGRRPGRDRVDNPYWRLVRDGLWTVDGAPHTDPRPPSLRTLARTRGRLPDDVAQALRSRPALQQRAIRLLLDSYFPPSLHADVLDAVGLADQAAPLAAEAAPAWARRRDPAFRRTVLEAYEHRCAVTGFRAALGGRHFGVEAAHVRWHAYGGPDRVGNGIALEPTLHKLLDAGAWSLTDDRRVLVSRAYTGTDEAVARLRRRSGHPLRAPLGVSDQIDPAFARWHRDQVFRGPALER